jgi:hypothetical protein
VNQVGVRAGLLRPTADGAGHAPSSAVPARAPYPDAPAARVPEGDVTPHQVGLSCGRERAMRTDKLAGDVVIVVHVVLTSAGARARRALDLKVSTYTDRRDRRWCADSSQPAHYDD